jgi:hypothetical protein
VQQLRRLAEIPPLRSINSITEKGTQKMQEKIVAGIANKQLTGEVGSK